MGEEDIAVTKFREYLRVNTEQPNPDYEACKDFLFALADELEISKKAVYMSDKVMFVIMTIPGRKPDLPSLALYSHTDVVPASKESWTHDPYSGDKDEEGNIFGRGAQDMKCVGSQYLEAIRRHFQKGKKQWERTIHIIYGPEEETGTEVGMKGFVKTKEFDKLNMDLCWMKESPAKTTRFWFSTGRGVKVTFPGNPGHGSSFAENTALEKMQSFINDALEFRNSEKKRMEEGDLPLGEVTTLNITMIEGGVQPNVVPEKLSLTMDMRCSPFHDLEEFEEKIEMWCEKEGKGVTFEFLEKSMSKDMTPTTANDPWWATFEGALSQEGCQFTKSIFYAATDSRFMRSKEIRCIGFSPIKNTPLTLHAHDEFIKEKIFLRGVQIYETLIDRLADMKEA